MSANLLSLKNDSSALNGYKNVVARGPLLDRVFSLRYQSYSAENYINKDNSGRFMDEYDSQSNCTSYLTYAGNHLLGSIRCCVYQPHLDLPIPAMNIFAREIEQDIGSEETFLEVNKFVVSPAFQNRGGIRAKFAIYSNVVEAVDQSGSSSVVVAVRPEHVKFYRLMFYTPISGEKSYPGLKFKTVLMICRDLEPAREFIEKQNNRRRAQ